MSSARGLARRVVRSSASTSWRAHRQVYSCVNVRRGCKSRSTCFTRTLESLFCSRYGRNRNLHVLSFRRGFGDHACLCGVSAAEQTFLRGRRPRRKMQPLALALVLLAAPSALGTETPGVVSSVLGDGASMTNTTGRRALASAGCNACCMQNDCSLAFSQSQPGVCCGAHRTRGQIGCCPMGASCVPCANICK